MTKTLLALLLGVGVGAWIASEHQAPKQVEATTEMLLRNLQLSSENIQLADSCRPR
jgi:hypothetical protein